MTSRNPTPDPTPAHKPICASCIAWDPHDPAAAAVTGLCRQSSPRPYVANGYTVLWPTTQATDTCRQWAEKPATDQKAPDAPHGH